MTTCTSLQIVYCTFLGGTVTKFKIDSLKLKKSFFKKSDAFIKFHFQSVN